MLEHQVGPAPHDPGAVGGGARAPARSRPSRPRPRARGGVSAAPMRGTRASSSPVARVRDGERLARVERRPRRRRSRPASAGGRRRAQRRGARETPLSVIACDVQAGAQARAGVSIRRPSSPAAGRSRGRSPQHGLRRVRERAEDLRALEQHAAGQRRGDRAQVGRRVALRPAGSRSPRRSCLQLLTEELVDDLGIRLPAGLLHHLADEEAEQALLAAAVRLDLAGVGGEDGVDERLELATCRRSRPRRGTRPPRNPGSALAATAA